MIAREPGIIIFLPVTRPHVHKIKTVHVHLVGVESNPFAEQYTLRKCLRKEELLSELLQAAQLRQCKEELQVVDLAPAPNILIKKLVMAVQ